MTYAIRVDFINQRVSIYRDHRATYEQSKAVAMARLWAEHYEFEYQEDDGSKP